MTKEARMTNDEAERAREINSTLRKAIGDSVLGIRISAFFRDSDFGIRHSFVIWSAHFFGSFPDHSRMGLRPSFLLAQFPALSPSKKPALDAKVGGDKYGGTTKGNV
jgi:hypothetical protein